MFKRAVVLLSILVLSLAAASSGRAAGGRHPSRGAPGSLAQRSNVPGLTPARYANSVVTRRGARLYVAGRPFRFTGANAESLGLRNHGPILSVGQRLGSERYATKYEIDDVSAALHEMRATVVRAQTVGDTIGCRLCPEPSGRFNPRAVRELDLVLAQARLYGIKIIGEFGGDANGTQLYGPPTPGAVVGNAGTDWYCVWNHLSQAACPTQTFESPRLLRDDEHHMRAVLDHVNPYTGLAYENDPTIAGWVDGNNLWLLNQTPLPKFESWLSKVSRYFKLIDREQLFIDISAAGADYLPPADRIDGFRRTPPHERPPAPIVTATRGGRVLFQGSAGAPRYSVQQLRRGRWLTRCHGRTTDAEDGWIDHGGGPACYRVIALHRSGRASSPSVPAGAGCPRRHDRAATAAGAPHWVGSWSAPPDRPGPLSGGIPDLAGTGGLTVRDVVHTTLGGPELRVRLSNVFGSHAVTFTDVRVAVATGSALPTTVAGTSRRVRFGGATPVSVPAGGEVASDPVKLPVRAGQNLAISIYAPASTGTVTGAGSLNHTNYISGAGDATAATAATSFPVKSPVWYWIDGVDVAPRDPDAGAIIALGDSITAGFDSTENANVDWLDLLANRLRAAHASPPLSVLNAGISGNNLHESSPCFGQSGLARLPRDVFEQPGVRDVIVDEGVNDITHPHEPSSAPLYECLAHRPITAAGMIADYREAIARIHAHHLQAIGVTLSPFGRYPFWSPSIEAERQQINHWIRTSHAFDGMLDFDRVLRDPAQPARLNPRYDSGDGLHPNDDGHAAMAASIRLSLFTGS